MNDSLYESCKLCMRLCGVNRTAGNVGFCRSGDKMKIARAALHYWEEPIISGTNGSGAIFFSGCSLSCVFCQNRAISRGESGREVTEERLLEIMYELFEKGAHNINLVTPTHFVPGIVRVLEKAKSRGFNLPIVYNTSSYDTVDTLKRLEGLVDIYLPDYKYSRPESAKKYSSCENYPEAALLAIDEMVRQQPKAIIENGIMKRGVIIRLLLLPTHSLEARVSLSRLYKRYGDNVYFSLMNQYTVMENAPSPINRPVLVSEYRSLTEYAESLGIKNAFVQEWGTASESFIPEFDNEGV